MKKHLLATTILAIFLSITSQLSAQVAINTDNSAPDNSAMLDVKSTTKGMLVPRMTITDRNAISNPATGLLVFCTDNNQYYTNNGTPSSPNWVMISTPWLQNGNDIWYTSGKVGIGTSSPGWLMDVAGDINYTGTLRKNGVAVVTGVSSVTATSPLSSSGGSGPNLTISQASGTTPGFLSSSDWNIFNNKQNTLTLGNVTSADMTITGGSNAIVGTGLGLTINKGALTSSDITITGGTNAVLGAGTALTVKKGNLTEATSSVLTIASGSNAVLGTGTTIQVKQAGTSQSGYLGSTDWNTFNNKVSSQWTSGSSLIYYNGGQVGIGTSTPNASAVLDVASTTKGFLPPRMTTTFRDAIASPSSGLVIWCNNCGTTGELQVYNGTAWTNMTGGAATAGLVIGSSYRGGKIAYIFQSGDPGYVAGEFHGLIAATSDQSAGIIWALPAYQSISVAGTYRDLGTGLANTNLIIAQNGAGTGYAAGLARSYNGGGYSDWYLPSQVELFRMYENGGVIGGFSGDYWSSSQADASNVWGCYDPHGPPPTYPKSGNYPNVRAVRTF